MTHHDIGELLTQRSMMTPGPSSIDPRVYRRSLAHLDPWFGLNGKETQILMRGSIPDRKPHHLPLVRIRLRLDPSVRTEFARIRR